MKNFYLLFSAALLVFCAACSPKTHSPLASKTVEKNSETAKQTREKIAFPRDFVGNWEGTLQLYNATKGNFQEVKMALNIRPLKDTANGGVGQYTYQLIYGDASADNRPYRLVAVDSTKQHWIVDENDGIKLDGYFIDDTFVQIFTVEGVTLTCLDRLQKDGTIYHEILSCRQKPVRTSGGSSKDVPAVDSYPVLSTQKAILKRK